MNTTTSGGDRVKSAAIEQIAESTYICCQDRGCGEPDCEAVVAGAIGEAYDKGYSAASKDTWVKIDGPETLPKMYDWYEVTILQTTGLGIHRYVDLRSWGNTKAEGDCWMGLDDGRVVIAYRERPSPFTEGDRDEQN